jgi:LacI family transcriptional regulator
MGSPTIKDVARASGVSVATVSYVINDGPRPVTEETRARVREAMLKLGYYPNASARRLRRQHNHVLGVALAGLSGNPGVSDLYFLDIIRGVSLAADRNGYDLMVFSNYQKLGSSEFYQSLAAQHMIDGLIAAGSSINPDGIALMNAGGTPAILVGRQRKTVDVRRIIFSYEEDAYWATQTLIAMGNRRIALFLNLLSMLGEEDRLRGYQRALRENQIDYDPSLVCIPDKMVQYPSLECVKDMLELSAPTAMITAPYSEVCAFLDQLHARSNIVVITLDEESHIPLHHRIVASARLAKYEAGLKAVDLLLQCIQGEPEVPQETVLPSKYTIYPSIPILMS